MSEHQVYGDWRDLRGAVEKADPSWDSKTDDERTVLWSFAEAVVANYAPMSVKCGPYGCGQIVRQSQAYRCADCNGTYCAQCIRPHFGASHRPPS